MTGRPVYPVSCGLVTPLGNSPQEVIQALWKGCVGLEQKKTYWGTYALGSLNGFEDWEAPEPMSRLENFTLCAARQALSFDVGGSGGRRALVYASTKGNIRLGYSEGATRPGVVGISAWLKDKLWPDADDFTISMACISGLAAVALAHDLISFGSYDDVLVCASDEISDFVVSGFAALKALSASACRPYDAQRNGINLGEAAAAVWLSHKPVHSLRIGRPALTLDGVHISAPDREGRGLQKAITQALNHEKVFPDQVDFISAHGTATLYNDDMESAAFYRLGLHTTPMHSLKGYFGHSLGAAALVELILAMEALKEGVMPASAGFEKPGTVFPLHVVKENFYLRPGPAVILKTASGFGGCNAAVAVFREAV